MRGEGRNRPLGGAGAVRHTPASDDHLRRRPRERAAPYEAWSKQALYARARALSIEGRSTMRKRDLVFVLSSW